MLSGSFKVCRTHLLQRSRASCHQVICHRHINAVQIIGSRQPRLHSGHTLHGLGQLCHDVDDGFLQVGVVRIELHLIVVIGQFHLEDGQALLILYIEELHPRFNGPGDQVFQLQVKTYTISHMNVRYEYLLI